MKTRTTALAAVLVFALSACGGGSGPTSGAQIIEAASGTKGAPAVQITTPASDPVAASSPAAASDPTASSPAAASSPDTASAPVPASTLVVKVAIYGDDQMAGLATDSMGVIRVINPNEPAQLQALLQEQFSDTGISVQNVSSGGTSSSLQNELDGMDGLGNGQPQRMAQSGASIVIEAHALNDALGGETVQEYAAYLGQLIQGAQASGLQPVLEEPSPVCDGNHPQLPAYVAAMDAAADTYKIPLVKTYSLISGINGWEAHMLGGCIVPDVTLDQIRAHAEQAVIAPLVKKASGDGS